jgi:hypothetical protein
MTAAQDGGKVNDECTKPYNQPIQQFSHIKKGKIFPVLTTKACNER